MSFIDRALNNLGLARAATKAEVAAGFVQVVTENDYFTPPRADARKLLLMYSNHPWTRAIMAKIGQGVARQGWYFETKDGDRIDEHPALDFIRAGSPKLRGDASFKVTTAQIDLTGESFWVVGREGRAENGRPVMYAPLPSTMVEDIPNNDDGFYDIMPTRGQLIRIPAKDVIYFKDPDPLAPFERGISITAAAKTEILTDEASSEYLYGFLKNRARPDYIISGTEKMPIDPKQIPRMEESWLQKFRGAARTGRPMFSPGEIKITEFGQKMRDNQFIEMRASLKDVFSEMLGVPPEIMGRLDNSNRATIDSADYLFGKHVLDPRLALILSHLWPFVRRNFDVKGMKLRYESPIADDKEFRLKVTEAHSGKFTGNEIRELAGLRPRPEKEMDDLPAEPEALADPNEPNGDDDGPDDEPPNGKGKKSVTKSVSPSDIVRVSGAHERPNVTADITRFVDNIVGSLLEEFGDELLTELEAGANFAVNGKVVNWLLDEVPTLIGQVNDTTRKDLAASLIEGAALNETVEALVERVVTLFDTAATSRAGMIGQTFATKMTGFASLEAARQAGFEAKKWLTSQDQVVRSTHSAMNGQVKPVDDDFVSPSGAKAPHPGQFGVASEDVQCRCALRPVLDGEKSAGMSDAEYRIFVDVALGKVTKKLKNAFQAVFDVQKRLAIAEINVLTGRA